MMKSRFYRKLFHLSSWNVLTAGFNFLSSIIIVKLFGVSIFGEFVYIVATCGLMKLIYLVIPSNYSIIKYQDDASFISTLAGFFFFSTIVLFGVVYLLTYMIKVPYLLLLILSLSIVYQSFLDIVFQAENRLGKYYFFLFLISVFKITSLAVVFFAGFEKTTNVLVGVTSLSSFIVIAFYLSSYMKHFLNGIKKYKEIFYFIYKKRKLFSTYYFNSILKILNSSLIILLFGSVANSKILGIYSLLLKVVSFVFGLVRTIESILLNKVSSSSFLSDFKSNIFQIGFFVQAVFVLVGVVYMNGVTGNMYVYYVVALSFLIYPYLFFIEARAVLIKSYSTYELNMSYVLFFFTIILFYIFSRLIDVNIGLLSLIILFSISNLIQQFYLIYSSVKKNRKNCTVSQE